MTHEVLSTVTPSEGSSNEVEEAGELFCPQSNTSLAYWIGLFIFFFHVLSSWGYSVSHPLALEESDSGIWIKQIGSDTLLVRACDNLCDCVNPRTLLSLRQIHSTCWIQTIYYGIWSLRLCRRVRLGFGWGKPCVYVSVNGIRANVLWSALLGNVYFTKPRGILCHPNFWNKVRK